MINKLIQNLSEQSLEQLTLANDHTDIDCANPDRPVEVMFPVAFYLHALTYLDTIDSAQLKKQVTELSEFLFNQSSNFSFNYWIKNSKTFRKFPLPDDIDDTAIALQPLIRLNYKIDKRYYLKIINTEAKPGGPYQTWYMSPDLKNHPDWSDIDPFCNANLLYLFACSNLSIKGLEKYLLTEIKKKEVQSPYYYTELNFILYISRYYSLTKDARFEKFLRDRINLHNKRELSQFEEVLLNISSLHTQGKILREVNYDCPSEIKTFPWSYGFPINKKPSYVANQIIMQSLYLEQLLIQKKLAIKQVKIPNPVDDTIIQIQKLNIDAGISDFINASYTSEYQRKPLDFISMIQFDFLSKEPPSDLRQFYIAAYYGWIGYTLLDQIIDEQIERSAIIYLLRIQRQLTKVIEELVRSYPQIRELYSDLLIVEDSYLMELENKFNSSHKDLSYIKDRMKGFTSLLRILPSLLNPDFKYNEQLHQVIEAIFVIDQLNDDAHDWNEDLKANKPTYITYMLKKHKSKYKSTKHLYAKLVLPKTIEICEKQFDRATRLLKEIKPTPKFLTKQLNRVYKPIKHAKDEIDDIEAILKYFS